MEYDFKIILVTRKEKKSLFGNISNCNFNNIKVCVCACACTGIMNNYFKPNSKKDGYHS